MQGNEETKRIPIREYLEALHERTLEHMDEPQDEEPTGQESQEEQIPAWLLLRSYILERSAAAQLAVRSDFANALSSTEEETQAAVEAMKTEEACADVHVIEGRKDVYYYVHPVMAHSFAQISADILDKDIPGGIERVVRSNQKNFHMPTPMAKFRMYPYFYTKVQIQNAVRQLLREKKDIAEYVTGNQKLYLYVSTEQTAVMARALAEDCEMDEWGDYRS